MTIFQSKVEFFAHGVEAVSPSLHQLDQDCTICFDPLDLVKQTSPEKDTARLSRLHDAVRIRSCGHIYGHQCLDAWLEVGHTCPTCKRMLFIPVTERTITQEDVNVVINELCDLYSEADIMRALMLHMTDTKDADLKFKQQLETKIAMEQLKEEEQARLDHANFMLSEESFFDSYDEDYNMASDEEDGADEDGIEKDGAEEGGVNDDGAEEDGVEEDGTEEDGCNQDDNGYDASCEDLND